MKGISPLLAAVLLIAIVLVVSVISMDWITTLSSKEGRVIQNKTTECSTASSVIQDVYVDLSTNICRISVRNTGFGSDELQSAVVLSKRGESSTAITAFPISFPQGAIQNLEVNISGIITSCDNFSKAVVSTSCVSAEFSEEPKCTA